MTEFAPGLPLTQPEQLAPTPSLQERIDQASANAVEIVPGSWGAPIPAPGSENHPVFNPGLSEFASLSDDEVIYAGDSQLSPIEANVVATSDPAEYWQLLRHALGLPLDSAGDGPLEDYARMAYDDVLEHAEVTRAIAPQADAQLSLVFFKAATPEGDWTTTLRPSIRVSGEMRKIDLAAIFAVQTHRHDPAPDSSRYLGSMGYASHEEVAERYRASRQAAIHDAMQSGSLLGGVIPADTKDSLATRGSGDRPDKIKDIPTTNPSSA